MRRIIVAILLVLQSLAGGAVTLAHARDVVVAPVTIESKHDARCAILHDELRCALCHYAGSRVVTQHRFTIPAPAEVVRIAALQPRAFVVAGVRHAAPARAPPAPRS